MALAANRENNGTFPDNGNQSYQRETAKQIADTGNQLTSAIERGANPGQYQEPCRNNGKDRQSDLCAQWTAADAGRLAAVYTARAFWAAFVAAILAFLALAYTVRGTKAAIEAVDAQIAADRPVVTLGGITVSAEYLVDHIANRQLKIKWWVNNSGPTNCWTEAVVLDFSGNAPSSAPYVPQPLDGQDILHIVSFVPSGKGLGSGDPMATFQFTEKEFSPIVESKVLFVNGWSIYRDAGGRRWKTGFAGWLKLDDNYAGTGFAFWPSEALWFDERLPNKHHKPWYKRIW